MSWTWQELEDLFARAAALPADRRAGFLDESCAGRPDLRAEIETLLDADGSAEDVVRVAVQSAAADLTRTNDAGTLLGAYRLLRPLGEGGMGVVWLAERADDQYRKQVAIKVIRGGLDSPDTVDRFRRERQVLATLEHPNIARLIEGGVTPDGRPFIVMEYIRGATLLSHAATHCPTIKAKLQLFQQVCSAVDYAHRMMIVHRDLKTSNIMVTPDGEVKLLDFGIAKLLDPTALVDTRTLHRMFTPEYASPEQVRGQPVGAASDVYSLGVILYELLSGRRPYVFDTYTPTEIDHKVCDAMPAAPHVNAELDLIVLMALRKEPHRRYPSAAALSEDLDRYLDHRPVQAKPDTITYRSRKFLRRNGLGVAAAGLVGVAVIAGAGVSTYQARRAELRFTQVRTLATTLLFDVHDAIEPLAGSTKPRELVVQTALQYLDNLARDASDDVALLRDVAAAFLKVAEIEGGAGSRSLGRVADAERDTARACGLYEEALRAQRDGPGLRALANCLRQLSHAHSLNGNRKDALVGAHRALAVFQDAAQLDPQRADPWALGRHYGTLATQQSINGQPAEAVAHFRLMQEHYDRMPGDLRTEAFERNRGDAYFNYLSAQLRRGALTEAVAIGRGLGGDVERLYQRNPANATDANTVADVHALLASALASADPGMQHLDDRRGALESLEKARAIRLDLIARDAHDLQQVLQLARVTHQIAGLTIDQSLPAAERLHDESMKWLAQYRAVNARIANTLSIDFETTASQIAERRGDLAAALQHAGAAVAAARAAGDSSEPLVRARVARLLQSAGRRTEALQTAEEAHATLQPLDRLVVRATTFGSADLAMSLLAEVFSDESRHTPGTAAAARLRDRAREMQRQRLALWQRWEDGGGARNPYSERAVAGAQQALARDALTP